MHANLALCMPLPEYAFKGSPIEKALVLSIPVKTKMTFLLRKLILLAILLHGQFIHHTKISLYPNKEFFITQQRAYQ